MLEYLPLLRKDPETGKNTYAVVQAEDELAAIGMAVGAGWAGLRAMTSTSGPGLSLMTEYTGLAYFAEVPLVVWDVQRVGPSTGLPTRTAQGDLSFVNFMGHGDTQQVILLPGSVNECFEFGWKAFDIAERLQTPVFVLIRSRFWHEPVDDQNLSSTRTHPSTAAKCCGKKIWKSYRMTGRATGTLMAMASLTARCRVTAIPKPPISHAVPVTTKRRVIPKSRRCGTRT